MKHIDRDARAGTRVRGLSQIGATFAFVLLGSAALSAFGNDAPNAPGGGGGGPTCAGGSGGGDDETVGTLPAWDGGATFDILRFARITRPSLYIQGSVEGVLSSAVAVRGDRRVLAQPMSNGELRLVFLGSAQVHFDRNAFHVADLQVGVAMPDQSVVLRSGAAWNGQALPSWTYVYELPIAQFESNGLLDLAPVIAGVSTLQGSTAVRAQANVDLVTLTQRH